MCDVRALHLDFSNQFVKRDRADERGLFSVRSIEEYFVKQTRNTYDYQYQFYFIYTYILYILYSPFSILHIKIYDVSWKWLVSKWFTFIRWHKMAKLWNGLHFEDSIIIECTIWTLGVRHLSHRRLANTTNASKVSMNSISCLHFLFIFIHYDSKSEEIRVPSYVIRYIARYRNALNKQSPLLCFSFGINELIFQVWRDVRKWHIFRIWTPS